MASLSPSSSFLNRESFAATDRKFSFLSSLQFKLPWRSSTSSVSFSFSPAALQNRRSCKPDSSLVSIAATAATENNAVACTQEEALIYPLHVGSSHRNAVPVYVMLPLDTVTDRQTVRRRRAMDSSLAALKSAGVEGVMVDVWWGLVERDAPQCYQWSGYEELFEMIRSHGLKIQAVMSFHQCGGNVGDSCLITLPKWVVEEVNKCPDLVYTDRHQRRNYEYISLGCDNLPVLKGRTPVQVYADYMRSFRGNFKDILGETIVEIQVGMGPAGELRYPSYPESDGAWRFPGVGEFQCYDKGCHSIYSTLCMRKLTVLHYELDFHEKFSPAVHVGDPKSHSRENIERLETPLFFKKLSSGGVCTEFSTSSLFMLANLRAAAEKAGKSSWGLGGPCDSGSYKNWPEETAFFRREGGGWDTRYGKFFLEWYSSMLLLHGERILSAAEAIFRDDNAVKLSGKVAGIHWHYGTRSHASELTAGYYNTRYRDGYVPIAEMFGRHGAILNFTCIEMRDFEHPSEALCSPEGLVRQVYEAARRAGVPVAGENALPRFDEDAYRQISKNSGLVGSGAASEPLYAFTFLRMSQQLFQSDNWRRFVPFVRYMAEGKPYHQENGELSQASESETETFFHASKPFVQEAEAALARG